MVVHASGEISLNYRFIINPVAKKDGLAQVQGQDFSELKEEDWVEQNADDLDHEIKQNMFNFSVRLSIEYFLL